MNTRNWYAWINKMPPPPDDFHVVGEVEVPNPGVEALLTVRSPQGINPDILLLDLHLFQKPGVWPQVVTWVQARYDKVLRPGSPCYTHVDVFYDNQSIAQMPVDTVV